MEKILTLSASRRRGRHKSLRLNWRQRAIEYIWPSMGMRAWLRWVGFRLMRQAADPHRIALGFAFGVWVCFFPVIGTHFLISFSLCLLFGGSILAAALGTFVGNPWTYGVMWWGGYELGRWLLASVGFNRQPVDIGDMLNGHLNFSFVIQNAERLVVDVLLPTVLGGVVLGAIVALLCYVLVLQQITRWRTYRIDILMAARIAREKRAMAQVKRLTGHELPETELI